MSSRTRTRPGARSDRGVVLLFFAISVTAMLTVGALVLGGSIGYTALRNAQNAADASSLAAASRLLSVKQGTASASEVLDTAISVAEDNGATGGSVTCEIVLAAYALTQSELDVIGPCNGVNELNPLAAGVRVRAGDTRSVPFNAFVDQETITGNAFAAATIQPVREGRSPFMVCASPSATGHPAPVLISAPADPTGYALNPSAIGLSYVLHGSAMKNGGRQCGAGSVSWRGFIEFGGIFPVPSADPLDESDWWRVKTGNANGHLVRAVAGDDACEGDLDDIVGCRLPLPLCPMSNGQTGVNLRLYCVKMGAFEITYNQNSNGIPPCNGGSKSTGLVCGTFLGAATVVGGRGGADNPDVSSVVVIKLVE